MPAISCKHDVEFAELYLQAERLRRGQHCSLLDCIQLSDKGKIIISKHETMAIMGLESRRSAKKVIREMESLRNNLAHAQDIVTYDWGQIVRLAGRLEEASRMESRDVGRRTKD